MFKFLKKGHSSGSDLNFSDLEGIPLKEGDEVTSLRYDLGKCRILNTKEGYYYESIDTGKKVHWLRMVDAATKNQKVRKLV